MHGLFLFCLAVCFPLQAMALEKQGPNLSPALERLIEGNNRYVNNKLLHPNRSKESRQAVFSKQKPFAIVLGCSDSRVSPELIFDEGIGDLFVVRVAGNVTGPIVVDSIEYAAFHLGASLLLVLGHEGCGAVAAVVQNQASDIQDVADLIKPAVEQARKLPGDVLNNAIIANVRLVVAQLKQTPIIAKLLQEGRLQIVGGYYHLKSGKVELLD